MLTSPHSSPRERLRRSIEHTRLKAETTPHDVDVLCEAAVAHGLFGVCVAPVHVALARRRLGTGGPRLVTVVGFPLGAHRTDVKGYECERAVQDGAEEIDMVIDLGSLRAGHDPAVERDIAMVVRAAAGRPVKVILETALLDAEQKRRACRLSVAGDAAFVKTSTGFAGGGATVDDVVLMRQVVGDAVGIKASGGIRSRDFALQLLAAGADRIGTSAGVELVSDPD